MSKLKISILVENTVGSPLGLIGEWGLAMLLDLNGAKILYDTGEQGHLLANAQALGIDLRQIDQIVLSHGHYDHTGGLNELLRLRGKVPIHAHEDLFTGHFVRGSEGQPDRYIGVPFRVQELVSQGAEFHWHKGPYELRPGLWLSGQIPRRTSFEQVDSRMLQHAAGLTDQDPILDDLSLFYVSTQGLVILLGCAHAGLVNIVEYAREVTGVSKVRAIVGGTHLGPASVEQQDKTIEYLHTLNLSCFAPNHCTGLPLLTRLAQEFPAIFTWASAGSTLEF